MSKQNGKIFLWIVVLLCLFILFKSINGIVKTKEESTAYNTNLNICLMDLGNDKTFNDLIINNKDDFQNLILVYNVKLALYNANTSGRGINPLFINNPELLFNELVKHNQSMNKFYPLISLKNMEQKTFLDCNGKYFYNVYNYVIEKTSLPNDLQLNINYNSIVPLN